MICAVCALAGDSLARKIAGHVDKRPTKRDLMVARELHRNCVSLGCTCQHKIDHHLNPAVPGQRA